MTPPPARVSPPVQTGNTFDKYGSKNPIVQRMMRGFLAAVREMLVLAAPGSILDVGCGEGVLTREWAMTLPSTCVVGLDLPDPRLQGQWQVAKLHNLEFMAGAGESLPFADGEFDLAAAIEVLEHVSDPSRVLDEMTRIARQHLLVSVPREPLWRGLNLARGAYLGRMGNTPGHIHHWSRRGLSDLLGAYGPIVELRCPLPWTVALVRVS